MYRDAHGRELTVDFYLGKKKKRHAFKNRVVVLHGGSAKPSGRRVLRRTMKVGLACKVSSTDGQVLIKEG